MYRHLARWTGMAAVVLAAAWPISVYTAYGWEAALVHATIAAAVYIMLLNALVMPLFGIHSARNGHPPHRYSGIAWWRKSASSCIIKPENFCRAGCLKTCRWFRFGWGCRWRWRLICWCRAGFAALQAGGNKGAGCFSSSCNPDSIN